MRDRGLDPAEIARRDTGLRPERAVGLDVIGPGDPPLLAPRASHAGPRWPDCIAALKRAKPVAVRG